MAVAASKLHRHCGINHAPCGISERLLKCCKGRLFLGGKSRPCASLSRLVLPSHPEADDPVKSCSAHPLLCPFLQLKGLCLLQLKGV